MENMSINLISEIEEHVAGVLTGPIEHPFRRIIRCTKLVLWLSFNVSANILEEYCIQESRLSVHKFCLYPLRRNTHLRVYAV